jgi:hypothetical protein
VLATHSAQHAAAEGATIELTSSPPKLVSGSTLLGHCEIGGVGGGGGVGGVGGVGGGVGGGGPGGGQTPPQQITPLPAPVVVSE